MKVYIVFDVFNDFIDSIWEDFEGAEEQRKTRQKFYNDLQGRPYKFEVQEHTIQSSNKELNEKC